MSVETVQESKAGVGSEGKKRTALGKGLESLLGPRPAALGGNSAARPGGQGAELAGQPNGEGGGGADAQAAAAAIAAAAMGRPLEIPIEKVERNPFQTRSVFDEAKLKELATSIRSAGVFQPVVVRALPEGRYQLIAGERRWRASQIAGKKTIPAIVRQLSELQAMEMTVIENLQREDLNPMDQARAFDRLNKEFNLTQEEMQERTGKDRASIGNFMRLLRLPRSVQGMIEAGRLSMGHGRAILALEDRERMESAAEFMAAGEMSVRTAEMWIHEQLNPEQKAKRDKRDAARERTMDPNVREAQDHLQRTLGLRVRIEDRKGKGKVIIEYSGVEDFDSLLEALGKR